MNGSEPSPGSEQIEHTKTECLYAKLCEREGNPRQLVSGSYQPSDSTPDWSDSEHRPIIAKQQSLTLQNDTIKIDVILRL